MREYDCCGVRGEGERGWKGEERGIDFLVVLGEGELWVGVAVEGVGGDVVTCVAETETFDGGGGGVD